MLITDFRYECDSNNYKRSYRTFLRVCKMIMKCTDAISFVLSHVYICRMNELICISLY